MPQSYWHLTGNLWALALSTAIALFLPDFGPTERMDGGVGVVIRATMAVPVVFTLLYFAGQPIGFLIRLARRNRLLSIITAGIDRGIRMEAERMTKEVRQRAAEAQQAAEQAAEQRAAEAQRAAEQRAVEAAERAAAEAAEQAAQARELEREQFRRFMRVQGLSEEQINAFILQLPG